jgi:hypothetical protein
MDNADPRETELANRMMQHKMMMHVMTFADKNSD